MPSGTLCMHSGIVWNILHAFWNILHAFWNILHAILSAFWIILHAFWNSPEHSRTFWNSPEHSGTVQNVIGTQTDRRTHGQTLGLLELRLRS